MMGNMAKLKQILKYGKPINIRVLIILDEKVTRAIDKGIFKWLND